MRELEDLIDGYVHLSEFVRVPDDEFDRFLNQMPAHVKGMTKTGSEDEYKARGATRPKNNIMEGKNGEMLARQYLKTCFGIDSTVDMEIYQPHMKRHDVDLVQLGVGVKTCTDITLLIAKQPSFTYQYGSDQDPIFRRPSEILKKRQDIMIYLPEFPSNIGVVIGIFSQYQIICHLRDPKKETLIGEKKCLYVGDFEHREGYDLAEPLAVRNWKEYMSKIIQE